MGYLCGVSVGVVAESGPVVVAVGDFGDRVGPQQGIDTAWYGFEVPGDLSVGVIDLVGARFGAGQRPLVGAIAGGYRSAGGGVRVGQQDAVFADEGHTCLVDD